MTRSITLVRTDVTDIGLKSACTFGEGTFCTGRILAVFHRLGTVDVEADRLNSLSLSIAPLSVYHVLSKSIQLPERYRRKCLLKGHYNISVEPMGLATRRQKQHSIEQYIIHTVMWLPVSLPRASGFFI